MDSSELLSSDFFSTLYRDGNSTTRRWNNDRFYLRLLRLLTNSLKFGKRSPFNAQLGRMQLIFFAGTPAPMGGQATRVTRMWRVEALTVCCRIHILRICVLKRGNIHHWFSRSRCTISTPSQKSRRLLEVQSIDSCSKTKELQICILKEGSLRLSKFYLFITIFFRHGS